MAEKKEATKPKKEKVKVEAPKRKPKERIVGIRSYLLVKGIPVERHDAMMAYTKIRKTTMKKWDEIFKSY